MERQMKVLVTGAKGFIGKNLRETLKTMQSVSEVFAYDIDSTETQLDDYCSRADFVFHLAGVNRPKHEEEFVRHNVGFTEKLLFYLKKHRNKAPILITSSVQSSLDNPYGSSKKQQEALISSYGAAEHVRTYIYRLPNVFGKWSRPNYNSVAATFCHNIARNLPIHITDPSKVVTLVYIDDVVKSFIEKLHETDEVYTKDCAVSEEHRVSLKQLADLIYSFQNGRTSFLVPEQHSKFAKKMYATYLSYLPETDFSYPLRTHEDTRGLFAEFLKSGTDGQISVNVIHPGFTKGNHWHHTKNEKFLAVSGNGVVCLRKIGETKVVKIPISAENLYVVDIPTGYTHNITNTGEHKLVVLIWANELFDAEHPDTYYEEV